MTSSRQSQGKPIESVELTITVKAGSAVAKRVKAAIPSARVDGPEVSVTVRGADPESVEAAAKEILEKLRELEVLVQRQPP